MIIYQMTIRARNITCERAQKKLPKSRLIFHAQGIEFWILGAIGKDFDRVANVAMNAMIESGRRASELRTVK
jgi:hypothetical protein